MRQRSYAATRLLRGFEVRTPFLARPWVDFMLGVPEWFRGDQLLYRETQKFAYPRLFSLPATSDGGGSARESRFTRTSRHLRRRAVSNAVRIGLPVRRAATPGTRANATIRAGYREPGQTQDLARENLTDLAARGVIDWLDIRSFLPGEPGRPASDEPRESDITGLLGLELNLKSLDRLGNGAWVNRADLG